MDERGSTSVFSGFIRLTKPVRLQKCDESFDWPPFASEGSPSRIENRQRGPYPSIPISFARLPGVATVIRATHQLKELPN